MFSSCSHEEEQPSLDQQHNIQRLEQKIDMLLQQEETEERVFLRNLKLLRTYVSTHSHLYDTKYADDFEDSPAKRDIDTTHYADLKSWSKQTLDNFSSFFIDTRGVR